MVPAVTVVVRAQRCCCEGSPTWNIEGAKRWLRFRPPQPLDSTARPRPALANNKPYRDLSRRGLLCFCSPHFVHTTRHPNTPATIPRNVIRCLYKCIRVEKIDSMLLEKYLISFFIPMKFTMLLVKLR